MAPTPLFQRARGLALPTTKKKMSIALDAAHHRPYSVGMENRIEAGSVVFHKPPEGLESFGRGVVVSVVHDFILDLDIYKVLWNKWNHTLEHYRWNLQTIAEKEAQ